MDKAGYHTDFLGTQSHANPEGGFTDGEHEGYPGCKIEDVSKKLFDRDKGSLRLFEPDVILILLGTNDVGQGQVDGASERLGTLINGLLHAKPKAQVFVGQIPSILPNAFSGYNQYAADVAVYNAAVASTVTQMSRLNKRVHLVDIHGAIPATNDYVGDGVHPSGYGVSDTKDGYAQLGDAWFRAIRAVIAPPGAKL